MPNKIDMTGQTFGQITVVKESDQRSGNGVKWECVCSCGKTFVACGRDIRKKHTLSCGCLQVATVIKRNCKHGLAPRGRRTRTYRSWAGMIQRCENSNSPAFKNYGGRGISVCARWHDFRNFLKDMDICPKNRSINRINNNGDYTPKNCHWASASEQSRNMRTNHFVTINGKTLCITDWLRRLCLHQATYMRRIRSGWNDVEALTKPVRRKQDNIEYYI